MKILQKRILSALLVFVMTLALVPFSVSAEESSAKEEFAYEADFNDLYTVPQKAEDCFTSSKTDNSWKLTGVVENKADWPKGDDQYCAHGMLETDEDGNKVIDSSDTEHWNTCLICGGKANATGHVVDESKQLIAGESDHTATCKDCGKEFFASHNGNGKLSYNTTTKKYDRLCECGRVHQAGETYFFVKKEAANISKPSSSTVVTDDGDFDYVRVVASAESSDFYWFPYISSSWIDPLIIM